MEGKIFPVGTSPCLHGINDSYYTFINEITIKVYCILLLNNLYILLIYILYKYNHQNVMTSPPSKDQG
jgi:hypothetical protein